MLTEFNDYLIARRRSPNTIRLRMIYLRQLEARCALATATLGDLEAVLASHPDWKPETINAAVSSWRVFYRWAIRRNYLTEDPSEFLETAYVPRVVKILADDARIIVALQDAPVHRRAILRLGREAALRRSEIATLHTDNRQGDWLSILGKGQRFRRIQTGGGLLEDLMSIEELQGPGYYFRGSQDGHAPGDTIYRNVVSLIGTSTHSLRRRSLTSVYRNSGGDLRLTQEFAGHADPATTAGYIEVGEDELMQAAKFARLA